MLLFLIMQVIRLKKGVWKFTDWPGLSSNVYLLELDVPTLIDLGNSVYHKQLVQCLKKVGYKPENIKRIIFTHLHFDHTGNYKAFKNADFYAGAEEIEDLEQGKFTKFLQRFGIRLPKLELNIKPVKKGFKDLVVIKTPGHTRGSISLWLKSKKLLFTGDTLFHNNIIGRTDLPTSVPEEMEKSLKKLKRYKYAILCPGH